MSGNKKANRQVKNLDEIVRKINEKKGYLKKTFKIRSIGVFGSFTKGEQNKESDIDIVVEFEETPGFDFFALWDYLEKLLKRKIDLTTRSGIRKEIKKKVLKEVVYI